MKRSRIIAIVLASVCVVAVAGGFVAHASMQKSDYEDAVRLASAGDTQAAYELFDRLGDYSDARAQKETLVSADPAAPYRDAARGSLVVFGAWEQDGDEGNGPEPIEWIVLDQVDDRLLLLSSTCLDARPYNPAQFQAVTWEQSALRAWLNADFLEHAFTDAERSLVSEVENENADRLGAHNADDPIQEVLEDDSSVADQMGVGGADTRDRVFLLSETEAGIYLHDDMRREAVGKAELAKAAAGTDVHMSDDGFVGWWLRSPGVYSFTAQFVDECGVPYPAGAYAELNYGVRPAIWLDVSSPDHADVVG